MVAAYLFLAAYLALAHVGSEVLPPPPKPVLVQAAADDVNTPSARDDAPASQWVASAQR